MPVNADGLDLEPLYIKEYEPYLNPLGVYDFGEIPMVGVAVMANVDCHATGVRVRDLPK